jgi:hypothetical protein
MTSAYLGVFSQSVPAEKIEQAWKKACQLFPLWKLYNLFYEIQWAEQVSPRFLLLQAQMQRAARQLKPVTGWSNIA